MIIMIEDISKLKKYNTRLTTVLNELAALEFSVDWIGRRISFLRELIRVKRVLLEVSRASE